MSLPTNDVQTQLPPEIVEVERVRARRQRSMNEMLGSGRLDRARRAMDEERR